MTKIKADVSYLVFLSNCTNLFRHRLISNAYKMYPRIKHHNVRCLYIYRPSVEAPQEASMLCGYLLLVNLMFVNR